MESTKSIEKLYTAYEFASILKKFNIIYNILKTRFSHIFNSKFWLNNNEYIINVERGIIYGDEKFFWDYLWATHSTIEKMLQVPQQKWKNTTYRCIKLIFWWWKSLTLCTNSIPRETPKGTLCLDEYYMKLNSSERSMYDNVLRRIGELEYNHFHSNRYSNEIERIKSSSKDNLFATLNMKKYDK